MFTQEELKTIASWMYDNYPPQGHQGMGKHRGMGANKGGGHKKNCAAK